VKTPGKTVEETAPIVRISRYSSRLIWKAADSGSPLPRRRGSTAIFTLCSAKLNTCWDQVQGKGRSKWVLVEDDAKGGWPQDAQGRQIHLAERPDEVALACMQKAVTATSFPKEGDTGASYFIDWNWPVPMPPDTDQQVARMIGPAERGTGCDGHGASARCVTCSGSRDLHLCMCWQ